MEFFFILLSRKLSVLSLSSSKDSLLINLEPGSLSFRHTGQLLLLWTISCAQSLWLMYSFYTQYLLPWALAPVCLLQVMDPNRHSSAGMKIHKSSRWTKYMGFFFFFLKLIVSRAHKKTGMSSYTLDKLCSSRISFVLLQPAVELYSDKRKQQWFRPRIFQFRENFSVRESVIHRFLQVTESKSIYTCFNIVCLYLRL